MGTIRPARFRDIPRIVELCAGIHGVSSFANRFALDEWALKKALLDAIGSHASKPGSGLVLVSETDGDIDGVFVGFVKQLYSCLDAYIASNVIWYSAPDARPQVAFELLKAFEQWLSRSDHPVIFRMGLSDAIQDPERMSKLLTRKGYRHSGHLFEKEISNG